MSKENSGKGSWYGDDYYFGLHYDFHAGEKDTSIGGRTDPQRLADEIALLSPHFVQTDCKGHAGMTSWNTEVPLGTRSPGIVNDALEIWRKATKKLGLPLHCHYSGIWDRAATSKRPEWRVVPNPKTYDKEKSGQNVGSRFEQKVCPRSGYLDELMIPQMKELIDRYEIDGFWIDGDIWAVEFCYCDKCRAAFTEETGIEEPPYDLEDETWPQWGEFQRRSYLAFATKYIDAVHQHKPGVKVCSNWVSSYFDPGEPSLPVDWLSGDNTACFGMDSCRLHSRFMSTRQMPWDIMVWGFMWAFWQDIKSPETIKSVDHLIQEVALAIPYGPGIQVYEHPREARDGRLAAWRIKHYKGVKDFVDSRREYCKDTDTVEQIAILHSEVHLRTQRTKGFNGRYDTKPVDGAVFSLLENSYSVDILDEWAMLPKIKNYPCIVVPETEKLSDEMVSRLKNYVEEGGKLFLSGADLFERFGSDFIGCAVTGEDPERRYHVTLNEETVSYCSNRWLHLKPNSATPLGTLGETFFLDEDRTEFPDAVLNKVGKGSVLYVPADLFRAFSYTRYPLLRKYIGGLFATLEPCYKIDAKGPTCVDFTFRKQENRILVHMINRCSGLPNSPDVPAVDEIPCVGPCRIDFCLSATPDKVYLAFSEEPVTIESKVVDGKVKMSAIVSHLRIHDILVIETSKGQILEPLS